MHFIESAVTLFHRNTTDTHESTEIHKPLKIHCRINALHTTHTVPVELLYYTVPVELLHYTIPVIC